MNKQTIRKINPRERGEHIQNYYKFYLKCPAFNIQKMRHKRWRKVWPIHRKRSRQQKLLVTSVQMLDLTDKDSTAAIINVFTKLKKIMFKEKKVMMIMSYKIENINKEI